jgi:hypothetical protein
MLFTCEEGEKFTPGSFISQCQGYGGKLLDGIEA